MTDFTPTPEAIDRVLRGIQKTMAPDYMPGGFTGDWEPVAEAAIAAFVEAEGMTLERRYALKVSNNTLRLVGPWRKRDYEPMLTMPVMMRRLRAAEAKVAELERELGGAAYRTIRAEQEATVAVERLHQATVALRAVFRGTVYAPIHEHESQSSEPP